MNAWTQRKDWLPALALALLMLLGLLFPLAAELTYAGSGETPQHILTYTTGRLTWDSGTAVDASGAARPDLFDAVYTNVQSENGDRVVAPGTDMQNIVRLKNNTGRSIRYVAVAYRIKEESELPVEPVLQGQGFTDTNTYPLPDGVTESQVVRAVEGTVRGGEIQDFTLLWNWNYYESDQRDQVDTALGDRAAFARADEVTAGIYIVVEQDEDSPTYPDWDEDPEDPDDPDGSRPPSYIVPDVPKTGDSRRTAPYLALMALSALVLALLILDRRRERKK